MLRYLESCPLCGFDKFKLLYPDNPSQIVRCKNCTLTFFNPQPEMSYLNEYYNSLEGFLPTVHAQIKSYESEKEEWGKKATFVLDKVSKYNRGQKGRILDVGCSFGFILINAREEGWEAYGIEPSSETSDYARQVAGIDVRTGTLETVDFKNAYFDCVVMNHVIEHLVNPRDSIRDVRRLIKKGGVLFVATPNVNSLVAEVDNYYWKWKAWPHHLFYFSTETLSVLLAQEGFDVMECLTRQGESDYTDDERIIRDRLNLENEEQIRRVAELLWELGKGQELVVIARAV